MALSIDIEPGIRVRDISERQSSFPPSRILFVRDPSLSQAFHMGYVSDVTITQEETSLYKTLRENPPNANAPHKSDQILMAEDVLTGEKSEKFKKAFPQIFPPIQ